MSHACAFGIALGKVNHAKGDIAAKHGGLRLALLLPGGVEQTFPHMGLVGYEFFKTKATHRAWRDVASNLRGFNGDGAAAAAGVVQRHALGAQAIGVGGCAVPLAPTAGGEHGGGQGFFQGRIPFVGAPAAFEQGLA